MITHTPPVHTTPSVVAVIGARPRRAVGPCEARIALTLAVNAPPVVAAVVRTCRLAAVLPAVAGETHTLAVDAASLIVTVVWARWWLRHSAAWS